MTFDFRPATDAEMGQIGTLTAYVFAGAFGDGENNRVVEANRAEWTLCAFDGDRMVTSYGAIPFTARANGRALPMAGVTLVGTLPEYRRRGLLREITQRSLSQMRENGQPVAALWASQAAIYQRYGYCMSAGLRRYAIDTADVALLEPPPDDYAVARAPLSECFDEVKAAYRGFIADRTLALHRAGALWQMGVLREDPDLGPAHVAICRDAGGSARGYVIYSLRDAKVDHPTRGQALTVRDLVWHDTGALRALWSFLAAHDLVGRILWDRAPMDDPSPELMMEPRLLRPAQGEGVMVRIVDAAAALAGRGYDADGEVVLGVAADRETPWNEGSYRLTVSDGEASVEKVDASPEVSFSIRSLASAWCGARRVRALADWGLVTGEEEAVGRADTLLATRHLPHCPDSF